MADIDIFHYRPGDSFLHQADPRFKIGSMILFGATITAGRTVVEYAMLTFILMTTFAYSGLGWKRLFHELRMVGVFVGSIYLVYAWTIPGHPLFRYIPGLSLEGSIYGFIFAWKIIMVFILGILLTGTTAPERISEAMESVLRPVFPAHGRIPAARVATMMGLTLVMVSLVLDQTAGILEAQAARNVVLRRNPVYRIRYLAIPLFASIFERAERLADAMEARCFSEFRTVTGFKPQLPDWVLLFFSMGLFLLVIWL